jgi:hypothetical protein
MRNHTKKAEESRLFTLNHIFFSMLLILLVCTNAMAIGSELSGKVEIAGSPIAGATVTIYAASAEAPKQLAQGNTDGTGAFNINFAEMPSNHLIYLVSRGGTMKASAVKAASDGFILMVLLGQNYPKKVTINELSTVTSGLLPRNLSMGKRSPEIFSDCESPPKMFQTLWILSPVDGAK